MVVSRFGDVDARVLAGTLTAQTLRRVVAGMVKRAMMSPIEGVEQSTETAGPFSRGLTYSNPSANLYFTRDDVRALSPVRRRAFTVDL